MMGGWEEGGIGNAGWELRPLDDGSREKIESQI